MVKSINGWRQVAERTMILTFETRHLVWGEFRELGDHWELAQLAQKAIPKEKRKQKKKGVEAIPEASHIYLKAPPKHLFCEKKKEIYKLK